MRMVSFAPVAIRFTTLLFALAVPLVAQRSVTVSVVGNEMRGAGTATIMLASQGNENALGFSVTFNPAVLRFESASNGPDVSGATVHVNTQQATGGRVGIVLGLPAGASFASGQRAILVMKFTVLATARTQTSLAFADKPVAREISDATAHPLSATYSGISIAVGPPTPVTAK